MPALPAQHESPWPRRLAVALCGATFPLIWVGGLVTSYDAGMAVPDWPTTYGYNLFRYPWQTWFFGPWDLFIEHGHRLLGAVVGMIAIALVAAVWRWDQRGWVRWLSVATLVAVIIQGLLGGMRVLADDVQLAKIHGCFGPAFFALAAAMATFTSPRWRNAAPRLDAAAPRLHRLALLTAFFAYLQLVLGAQLRHLSVQAAPSEFRIALYFHLLMAAVVTVHVLLLALRIGRQYRGEATLRRPALVLVGLVVVQLALGAGTWLAKYGAPAWLGSLSWAAGYTVSAASPSQALVATAHVATGSLILAAAVVVALRSMRLVRGPARALALMPLVVAEAAR